MKQRRYCYKREHLTGTRDSGIVFDLSETNSHRILCQTSALFLPLKNSKVSFFFSLLRRQIERNGSQTRRNHTLSLYNYNLQCVELAWLWLFQDFYPFPFLSSSQEPFRVKSYSCGSGRGENRRTKGPEIYVISFRYAQQ